MMNKDLSDKEKEFIELFDRVSNNMSLDTKALAEAAARTHLTLQQIKFKFCLEYILAVHNYAFEDGRNEFAKKIAKEIIPVLEKEYAIIDGKVSVPVV